MYLMTCTRPDLAYPLSILARYVAPGRHRPEHMAAAKRVLRYLCSISGMGLVLGGRSPVVLTGHADASWADDQATQRSSQGYTFSLGSGSVSWRATRSSSVLGSSCEAEIYAGAMAAQELRWLTYLLTNLGEPPRSPPVLYVDNKAMLALCREQRLEHRTKHIALRYFLARELQQRGQLRLAYVASEANTADVFTKALAPCDHQRFCTQLACFALVCLTGLRREPETCASTPERRERETRDSVHARVRRVRRLRSSAVPRTHDMTLHPSSVPQCVVLPSPPTSSLPDVSDSLSDLARASSPTVTRLLATVVTDPTFSSPATSALVTELVDFAVAHRLDYLASLVSDPDPACPVSVGGAVALGCDVLEDRHKELECLAATAPHLATMLLAPEGDPDALNIPTLRSFREAILGECSSQWQIAMDAEMASWKSTGTYVDEVPPPGVNIVSGMWIFRLSVTMSCIPSTSPQLSCRVAIWLRRPPGFTGLFPEGTQWSLQRPLYGLHQAPCEWHDTLRTTLAALGFASSTADPSLFLLTDTSLPPFYVLAYVLQCFGFQYPSPQPTPLSTGHSLSAPPSDESEEPSGPYPELVGCLMYLMTCTRPDLSYPLSLLARYVALGRHRKVRFDAAKKVLRYLCSTSGMGLVLGGRGSVVLTGHSDASWADDQAIQRSYEAEIYVGAMVAHELRWVT
ncbi:unnamed protein product [Closterium sp. NIES-53]